MKSAIVLGISIAGAFTLGVFSRDGLVAVSAAQTTVSSAVNQPGCPDIYIRPAHPRSEADTALLDSMLSVQRCLMSVGLTGDIDRDFVLSMIPYQQAEITMASVETKYGKNAVARGLARTLITARSKEIGDLSKWLNEPSP